MSDTVAGQPTPGTDLETPVLQRLSTLDRYLPVWIVAAMALGLVLGRAFPGLDGALDTVQVVDVSLPIAAGLLLMVYPVLVKVRYGQLPRQGRRPAHRGPGPVALVHAALWARRRSSPADPRPERSSR